MKANLKSIKHLSAAARKWYFYCPEHKACFHIYDGCDDCEVDYETE